MANAEMEQGFFGFHQLAWRRAKSVLFFLFLALVLECATRFGLVSSLYIPPFSKILGTFWDLTWVGVLPGEVANSLLRMALGYGLSIATMIPLGIWIGTHRRWHATCEPLMELLRPLPPPAIIPIAMLFLGIGDAMRVFVVFFACSFPIITNSIDGARSVHPLFIHTGQSLGLGRLALLREIILPAASPQIMSGLRISQPICLIVTILAEMIGGEDGIGHWTLRMQRTFSIPEMYSGVLMTGLLGYLLNRFLLWVEQRYLGWHQGWKHASK
jgi:ABC-type nitrate/sulfonate/bicarbonate transport system permease component